MIEAYAFLAAFTVQILVVAVLLPAWFIRFARAQTAMIPSERLAQLYPGVDASLATERFLTQYRALTSGIGVLSLLLLLWLFSYTQRPDWAVGPVTILAVAQLFAGWMLPILFTAWIGVRYNKKHRQSLPEAKRKATLQRRGLFDFVSPYIIFVAVLGYFLFAAFVISLQHRPPFGLAGLIMLGGVTLCYAADAFAVYLTLYGKKANPFESHAGRLHTISLRVKGNVYGAILLLAFMSLVLSLALLDLEKWVPFSTTILLVTTALLSSRGFTAPLRKPEVDELSSNPVS